MIDVSGRFDAGLIGVLWQVESVGWLRVPYATGTIYGVATGLRGYVKIQSLFSFSSQDTQEGRQTDWRQPLKL